MSLSADLTAAASTAAAMEQALASKDAQIAALTAQVAALTPVPAPTPAPVPVPVPVPTVKDALYISGWDGTSTTALGRLPSIHAWESNYRGGKLVDVMVEHVDMANLASIASPFFLWYYAGAGGKYPRTPYQLSITSHPMPWGMTIADANAGKLDATWASQAKAVAAYGYQKAYCRAFHEMNGDYPWNAVGNPAGFIAMFRRYVGVIRANGWTGPVVWSPLLFNGIDPSPFYPGDDVVDIIGGDSYPGWQGLTADQRWNRCLTDPAGFNWQIAFAKAHGKKLSLDEGNPNNNLGWAPNSSGDDPTFVQHRWDWTHDPAHPYEYVCIYNDNNAAIHSDLRSAEFPLSAARLKSLVTGV